METLLYVILTCMIDDTMPLYLFVFVLFFYLFLHISLLCRHLSVLLCFFLALLSHPRCVRSIVAFLFVYPTPLCSSIPHVYYCTSITKKWLSIHIAVIIITTPLALAADFPPPKDVSLRSREGRTALACICALPEILYI